jgi:ribosome-binding protein aMBF1 (putative translation factor)
MKECFKCSANESEAVLMRAISKEGMVYVCNRCQIKERLPLIKEGGKVEEVGERMSVRQRLEIMSGVKRQNEPQIRSIQHMGEEIQLKDLVEKNFQEKIKKADGKVYSEMVPNFHWIVMRKRRILKLSQEELANKIAESVSSIQALERGVLPSDYLPLVRKVERALGVFIMKEPKREFVPEDVVHESKAPTGLTIGDLREKHIKEKSKWSLFGRKKEEKEEKIEEKVSEDDLTEEEMEKIIFQRD